MKVEALVMAHKDSVYGQMLRVCGNYDDADDALADAILAAYQSLPAVRDARCFRSWLTRVAERCCSRSQIRRRVAGRLSLEELASRGVEPEVTGDSPEQAAMAQAIHECVAATVERLSRLDRAVYLLSEADGYRPAAIASQLALSESAVRNRLRRARAQVRGALDEQFAWPAQ